MQKNDLKRDRPEMSDEQLAKLAAEGNTSALTILTVRYCLWFVPVPRGIFPTDMSLRTLSKKE